MYTIVNHFVELILINIRGKITHASKIHVDMFDIWSRVHFSNHKSDKGEESAEYVFPNLWLLDD
jgi:hypothetical protein